jgi:hypothetical protein
MAGVWGMTTENAISLLNDGSLELGPRFSRYGLLSALRMASVFLDEDIARILLHHSRMSDDERIWFLKASCATSRLGRLNEKFHSSLKVAFEMIDDSNLNNSDLIEFINGSDIFERNEIGEAFLQKALQQQIWKGINNPYHKAARFGNRDMVEFLWCHEADPTVLDEDGWSCADVAAAFGHHILRETLINKIQHTTNQSFGKREAALITSMSLVTLGGPTFSLRHCSLHTECIGRTRQ